MYLIINTVGYRDQGWYCCTAFYVTAQIPDFTYQSIKDEETLVYNTGCDEVQFFLRICLVFCVFYHALENL